MNKRAAMQNKPTNVYGTTRKLPIIDLALENRKRSLPAHMPPPPKPATAKLPMINTAVSRYGEDVRTPGTKRAAQQYGQADLLSPGKCCRTIVAVQRLPKRALADSTWQILLALAHHASDRPLVLSTKTMSLLRRPNARTTSASRSHERV